MQDLGFNIEDLIDMKAEELEENAQAVYTLADMYERRLARHPDNKSLYLPLASEYLHISKVERKYVA